MSEFKVGDKVWPIYDDGSPAVGDLLPGWFWGIGDPEVVTRVGPMEVQGRGAGPDRLFCEGDNYVGLTPDYCFHTRREALAEAIRQNEGLASALTLEIARLKEELVDCKD